MCCLSLYVYSLILLGLLLIHSCIFSVLFSRFLIIFTIIILNSFSGNLPISSSFIWPSVFLVCYFICIVFLCLFYFFLTYCVWYLLFPGFKIEFFLPFGFCPPKVGPVVCVSFVYGEICAEIFVSLFVFPLMVKAEWGGNPVCWWYGLYFCLLFRWGVLHSVQMVVGWCQVF